MLPKSLLCVLAVFINQSYAYESAEVLEIDWYPRPGDTFDTFKKYISGLINENYELMELYYSYNQQYHSESERNESSPNQEARSVFEKFASALMKNLDRCHSPEEGSSTANDQVANNSSFSGDSFDMVKLPNTDNSPERSPAILDGNRPRQGERDLQQSAFDAMVRTEKELSSEKIGEISSLAKSILYQTRFETFKRIIFGPKYDQEKYMTSIGERNQFLVEASKKIEEIIEGNWLKVGRINNLKIDLSILPTDYLQRAQMILNKINECYLLEVPHLKRYRYGYKKFAFLKSNDPWKDACDARNKCIQNLAEEMRNDKKFELFELIISAAPFDWLDVYRKEVKVAKHELNTVLMGNKDIEWNLEMDLGKTISFSFDHQENYERIMFHESQDWYELEKKNVKLDNVSAVIDFIERVGKKEEKFIDDYMQERPSKAPISRRIESLRKKAERLLRTFRREQIKELHILAPERSLIAEKHDQLIFEVILIVTEQLVAESIQKETKLLKTDSKWWLKKAFMQTHHRHLFIDQERSELIRIWYAGKVRQLERELKRMEKSTIDLKKEAIFQDIINNIKAHGYGSNWEAALLEFMRPHLDSTIDICTTNLRRLLEYHLRRYSSLFTAKEFDVEERYGEIVAECTTAMQELIQTFGINSHEILPVCELFAGVSKLTSIASLEFCPHGRGRIIDQIDRTNDNQDDN